MNNSEILKSVYESNIKTYKMLVSLLNKWHNKSYNLTDKEWETIKYYKSVLDTYFNDPSLIKETIKETEKLVLKYS